MRLFFGLLALCWAGSVVIAQENSPSLQVSPLQTTLGRYEKFEALIVTGADFNNPYDPREIQVEVIFTAPSGAIFTIPAFYYQEFTYADGTLTATEEYSWRVRFTPQESGNYNYQGMVTTPTGSEKGDISTFTVVESDERGFVRVAENSRYLAFENGETYFPVGLNMAWSNGDTIGDYATWLDALQANGGNFIRLWMAPWNMSIEWIETGLGNYNARQFRAYELDQVLDMAAERGIYIMLTLLNHGQFNESVNPEWDQNPYNLANGGMCATPECFATDPEAIRFWEQRLRYMVARWGYSPHIMAWEWWNEVNWTPLSGEEILAPWIERNTALLHELDPYNHLITHSGSPAVNSGVWNPLDFTQDHYYDKDDFLRTFKTVIPDWATAYPDKPFLVGEFGRSTSALAYDVNGVELHLGIWGAPMNGAAGTAMSWWWDTYIHPNNLWSLYAGVSAFFADENLGNENWQPAEAALSDDGRVFGLQAADRALLWVVSQDYSTRYLEKTYLSNLRNKAENPLLIEFPEVTGAILSLAQLPDGIYQVEIWDTFTGEILTEQTLQTSAGTLAIPLPTFNRDLALKIKPERQG